MTQTKEKPPTVLSHGDLPYPNGTLVEDTETGWANGRVGCRGHLEGGRHGPLPRR